MREYNKIDEYIILELKKFKFNTTSLGFKYIKYAIKKGIQNEALLENFNQKLYKEMQIELKIKRDKIKWNIEKSINYMYLNTDMEKLINYFALEINQKITPKLFIVTLVENYYIFKQNEN